MCLYSDLINLLRILAVFTDIYAQLTYATQADSLHTGKARITNVVHLTDAETLSLLHDSANTHYRQSTLHQSNLKRLLYVFNIKVNILCFVCAADASLWLDHLICNVVSRKQSSFYVYVA